MYWKSQEISFEKKIEKSKRWKEIVGYNERNRVSQSGFPPPSLLRGRIKRFLRLIWWKLLPRAIFGRSKNLWDREKRRNIKFHWRQLNNEKKYSNCSALKLNITAAGFGFIKGRLTISTNGIFWGIWNFRRKNPIYMYIYKYYIWKWIFTNIIKLDTNLNLIYTEYFVHSPDRDAVVLLHPED